MDESSSPAVSYATLEDEARSLGLACRGGFHPVSDDGVPPMTDGMPVLTLVLLGFTGSEQWPVFAASEEFRDGRADPLDRWSRRIIDALARRLGANPLYPAPGPPWWPFLRWARRAENVYPSPLGILIHPQYGLWHAYRGALAFGTQIALPTRASAASPCASCSDRPCLNSCPVGAVRAERFEYATCDAHLETPGNRCRAVGCLARIACPVGARYRYSTAQAAFHMESRRK